MMGEPDINYESVMNSGQSAVRAFSCASHAGSGRSRVPGVLILRAAFIRYSLPLSTTGVRAVPVVGRVSLYSVL